MLVQGKSISDLKTQHIDVFTCNLLMDKCTSVEQQYSESQKFIRSVKSELIRGDIARMLAKRWNRMDELDDVKRHLNVQTDGKEEKLKLFHDVLSCMNDWESLCESEGRGIGWPEVDATLDNVRDKEIILLGGYSTSGKSTVMTKVIAHRIMRYQENVLVFSQEMPRGQLIEAIACEILGMHQYKLKEWRKTDKGLEIYQKLMEVIGNHLLVVDKSGMNMRDVWELTELANEQSFSSPVKFVAFDHFHLIPGVGENTVAAENANLMKDYVKTFGCVLLMLVQFNENSQRSSTGKFVEPSMTSIRGCNDLKAIADTIILLWREYYRTDLSEIEREERKYITMAKIGKHRRGIRYQMYFKLLYDADTTRMSVVT